MYLVSSMPSTVRHSDLEEEREERERERSFYLFLQGRQSEERCGDTLNNVCGYS